MKTLYNKQLRLLLNGCLMLLMAFGFSVSTVGQSITLNDNTLPPNYPYETYELDYTAADFDASVSYYAVIDLNNNGYTDLEDHILDVSTDETGVLSGTLPKVIGNYSTYIRAAIPGSFPSTIEDTFTGQFAFISTVNGSASPGPSSYDMDLAGTREFITASIDLSDASNNIIRYTIDASSVLDTHPVVVQYSDDGGSNFNPLSDVFGTSEIFDTTATFTYQIPASADLTDIVVKVSQNNSGALAASEQPWTLNPGILTQTDGEYIQIFSQFTGSLDILSPDFTFSNEVPADTVGEEFSVDYEVFGFTTGAVFYAYTGNILDPEDRIIYDQSSDSPTGTFEGQFPLQDQATIDQNVRVAGIYGNIDEPTINFSDDELTVIGSTNSDYSYNFNQNGVRSIRTNEVDISGESYASLVVDFGFVDFLDADDALSIQYSTNGSSWTDLDVLDGNFSGNVMTYELDGDAISTSTSFRIIQSSFDNGGANIWVIDQIEVQQYVLDYDQLFAAYDLSNYELNLTDVFDEDGNNITLGGSVFPGDSINLAISAHGFDVEGEDYTVLIDGQYFLDIEEVTFDAGANTAEIAGRIPKDIPYMNGMDLEVYIYEGTEPLIGINEDVFDDYDEEEISITSGEYFGSYAEFAESGERSLTTPAFSISATDGLELSFYLYRLNSVRSPAGTEVQVEYSTDGENYTSLGAASLNSAGSGGATFVVDTFDGGVVSENTTFRFRQLSNNGTDLDAWGILNVTLAGSTNFFVPDYLDYNVLTTINVLSPIISLSAVDDGGADLYPGTPFTVEATIDEGAFPAGTELILYIDRGLFPVVLESMTLTGSDDVISFNPDIPALVPDNYDIYAIADYAEVTSNSSLLPIIGVQINNIEITSDDALEDGFTTIIYPGSTVDISYNVVGDLGTGVTASLEVYDANMDAYVSLATLEDVDGTISGTIPLGLDYSGDPLFRLSLVNGNLETVVQAIDEFWSNDTNLSDQYFPLDQREGHSHSNYFQSVQSERSATSIPFDFSGVVGAAVKFDMVDQGFNEFAQEIFIHYSIDAGETWVELDSDVIDTDFQAIFGDYVVLPEEALTEETYIRFIYNEDGAAGEFSQLQNYIYFQGFELRTVDFDPISTADFNLSDGDIGLELLSVSVSDLGDPAYKLGEEFTVEYNADGPFPSDVNFAIVMEQGGEHLTLAESDATGAAQVMVNFPSTDLFGDPNMPYNLSVEPFVKADDNDSYRPNVLQTDVDEEEQFLVIEGRNENETGFSAFNFNETGDRLLLTDAFDLTATDTVELVFTFSYGGGTPSTLLTLPQLQISTDGGASFDVLSVEGSGYEDEGYLFNTGTFSVPIPSQYLTDATHFMWIQALNRGDNQNSWSISNIRIDEGESNSFGAENFLRGPNNDPSQMINAVFPDFADFVWRQNVLTDAVFNGEDFEYLWTIDSAVLESSTFPEGTQFTFTLEGVTDPETDEDVIIGTTTMYGVNTASIPDYVLNDNYNVRAFASITLDVDGEPVEISFGDAVVGSLDVFLKAIRTTYTGDLQAVLYAGNTATFSIVPENDETNTATYDDLFANLIVKNYSGQQDLIIGVQQGIDDMTVDLPPYVRGREFEFEVRLTETSALGVVGDLGDFDGEGGTFVLANPDDYLSGSITSIVETADFWEYFFFDVNSTISWDYDFDPVLAESTIGNERMALQYSTDQGNTWSLWTTFTGPSSGSYNININNFMTSGFNTPSGSSWESVRFRWYSYDPWQGGSNNPTAQGSKIVISNAEITDYSQGSTNLEDNPNVFPNGGENNVLTYDNSFGRGIITTRDFEGSELSSYALLTFDITFGEILDDIADDQVINIEYSMDGGGTYESLGSIPNEDLYDDDQLPLDAEPVGFVITDEMKTNGARFRFRQEERNDILVEFTNVAFTPIKQLPFDYISDSKVVADQALLIPSLGTEELCYGDGVTISYEIRGKFGANVRTYVEYAEANTGNWNTLDGFEFNLVEGTGTVDVELPSDLLSQTDDNTDYQFRLYFEDDTYDDFYYSEEGTVSENKLEVVAPINQSVSLSYSNPLECDASDMIVTLNGEQDYFMYEVINLADGSVLASTIYDPEVGDDDINLGSVSESYDVSVRTTAMTSSGAVCNSLTSTTVEEIELYPNYELYRRSNSNVNLRIKVEPGESKTICEGTSGSVRLSVNRMTNNGVSGDLSGSSVEWFRDNLNTPVTITGSILGDNENLVAGNYFARVTTGNCVYTTESFEVITESQPEKPEITVVSGSLSFCENEGEVVLSAPDGFNYYTWSTGETSQQITVTSQGSYYVSVSNLPTSTGCGSSISDNVVVESFDNIDLKVHSSSSTDDQYEIQAGEVLTACDSRTVYFFDNNSTSFNGVITLFRDGAEYKSTTSWNLLIEDSGEYFAEWTSDEIGSTCSQVSPTFTIEITESPEDAPVITTPDAKTFCEGGSATLTASEGFTYYRWYRNSSVLSTNSRTLTVTRNSGRYQVEGSNVPFSVGCFSARSAGIDITVYTEPDMEIYSNFEGNLDDDQTVDFCEVDDNHYLRAYNSTGVPATWYLDGTPIAASSENSGDNRFSYIYPTASGAYYAEVTIGGADPSSQCTFTTNTVNVNYNMVPAAVTIADPSAGVFCANEVEVTLTADAGASFYRWYRNGSAITDGSGASNSITVTSAGDYTVTVSNAEGCESDHSNIVTIEETPVPSTSISVSTFEADCNSGDVTLSVFSTNQKYTYQLMNRETGENVGSPFTGKSGTKYVTLSGLTESTPLMAEISYADGTGCTSMNTNIGTANPNSVVLEIDGLTLRAVISGSYVDLKWFRNGVEMKNATGTTLSVTDAATYSIEVTFVGGCMVMADAVDLGGGESESGRLSNGRMVANTFPNPSADVVNMDIPGDDIGTYDVRIMTLSGQVLIEGTVEKTEEDFTAQVLISDLEPGIYNMQVIKGKKVENIRIVKKQ